MPDPTSFGFRDVDPADKAAMVRGVFESVAARYDLMNDLMSGGVHRLWKSVADRLAGAAAGRAFHRCRRRHRRYRASASWRGGRADGAEAGVTVCDLTPAMLETGRARAIDRGLLQGIDWIAGDAESLPFADRSFDAYTIAFGLRNVDPYRQGAGGSAPRAEAGRAVLLP